MAQPTLSIDLSQLTISDGTGQRAVSIPGRITWVQLADQHLLDHLTNEFNGDQQRVQFWGKSIPNVLGQCLLTILQELLSISSELSPLASDTGSTVPRAPALSSRRSSATLASDSALLVHSCAMLTRSCLPTRDKSAPGSRASTPTMSRTTTPSLLLLVPHPALPSPAAVEEPHIEVSLV